AERQVSIRGRQRPVAVHVARQAVVAAHRQRAEQRLGQLHIAEVGVLGLEDQRVIALGGGGVERRRPGPVVRTGPRQRHTFQRRQRAGQIQPRRDRLHVDTVGGGVDAVEQVQRHGDRRAGGGGGRLRP